MADVEVKWFDVEGAADLWQGDLLDAEVGGDQVLLVHHLDGTYKAYQGVCPHQEILLADGGWDEDTGVLTCSGHNWEFDMKAGVGINPSGCRLFEYPVRVRDEGVEVGIPQDGQSHYNRCPGT
ncbi:Rieske 2Fe-2S domain-containing protein [Pseudonocardia sp. WMMC193]|uniref:Rieske 2Fe-2S domain-containing protein n=1 Tax=Pseudonocardia sp. WMMC193 TaxID=2911965 RepID=UPI001F360FF9|nr:Rieske 2Fe-2S domain-containing protein [Pseudonocardia sp. WMMC193]MCF7550849.1 Rieske 2Fe-2S domain-containing protein [Pseudonocardia sp. WMMC193]